MQYYQQSQQDPQQPQMGQIINGSQYPVDENGFYIDINGLGNYPNEWMEQNQLPPEAFVQQGYQNQTGPVYMDQMNLQQIPQSTQSGQPVYMQMPQQGGEQLYHNAGGNVVYGNQNQVPGSLHGPQGHMVNQQHLQNSRPGGGVMGQPGRQYSQFGGRNNVQTMNDDSLYLNLEEEYLHKVSLKQDKKSGFGGRK